MKHGCTTYVNNSGVGDYFIFFCGQWSTQLQSFQWYKECGKPQEKVVSLREKTVHTTSREIILLLLLLLHGESEGIISSSTY